MFGRIGLPEIAILIVIIMIFFGGKKIPELMRGMGQGIKEFKKGLAEGEREGEEPEEVKNETKA